MPAAVSALDVALATAVVAIVGAVAAPMVTWVVATARERHERWLQRYGDLRDASLGALRQAYRSVDVLREFIRVLEEEDPASMALPTPLAEDERSEVLARIALFASPKVAVRIKDFEDARRAAMQELLSHDVMSEDGRRAAVAQLRPALELLEAKVEELRSQLHAELTDTR